MGRLGLGDLEIRTAIATVALDSSRNFTPSPIVNLAEGKVIDFFVWGNTW